MGFFKKRTCVAMSILKCWGRRTIGFLAAFSLFLLIGCGASDHSTLKVGVIAGPEADIMQLAAKEAERIYGLKIKLVEFQDFITPNIALIEGSIDVNAFQHKPYMDNMVKERGFAIKAAGNTFIYPIGAYSSKLKSIDVLPFGAKIAIPNDPTNEGRALLILHRAGLITLKNSDDLTATPADIVKNEKKLSFMELDAAQLPRSLEDVDLALINSVYAVAANLFPTKDAILLEDKDSPYMNVFAVRNEPGEPDEKVSHLIETFQTDVIAEEARERFKGGVIVGW